MKRTSLRLAAPETSAAQQAVEADGRASWLASASCLEPVVAYHGLARCFLMPPRFLMPPQLNSGTLGGPMAMGDLNGAEHALAQYMSDLSEEAYSAGWMDGLEDALWEVVLGERRKYGQSTFTDEHAVELRRLSKACGGWIVFDDSREETWISLSDWQALFQGRKRPGLAADVCVRTSPLRASNAPYSRAELLAAEDGRWPERGDPCKRCGVLIPRFCDNSLGDLADILDLKRKAGVVDAMDELRKRTGAPVRFAKIWVIHHGEPRPRYSGPPCPHCGKPLASDRAKQCLHCHTDWH